MTLTNGNLGSTLNSTQGANAFAKMPTTNKRIMRNSSQNLNMIQASSQAIKAFKN